MSTHLLPLSEGLYGRLNEEAARLKITPEQLIERLLAGDTMPTDEEDVLVPPANSDEALAAVERLATLFADVAIPDLDQVLTDPMIALANADAAAPLYDS